MSNNRHKYFNKAPYSTALSARYDGWAGLYDEHGQHTIVLIEYD